MNIEMCILASSFFCSSSASVFYIALILFMLLLCFECGLFCPV